MSGNKTIKWNWDQISGHNELPNKGVDRLRRLLLLINADREQDWIRVFFVLALEPWHDSRITFTATEGHIIWTLAQQLPEALRRAVEVKELAGVVITLGDWCDLWAAHRDIPEISGKAPSIWI